MDIIVSQKNISCSNRRFHQVKLEPKKKRIILFNNFDSIYPLLICVPSFEVHYELCIDCDLNNNRVSWSNPGDTYEVQPVQTNKFLVGTNNDEVSEIELFQIVFQFIILYNIFVVQKKKC